MNNTYTVKVRCNNCKEVYVEKVGLGIPIKDVTCEYCECKTLEPISVPSL